MADRYGFMVILETPACSLRWVISSNCEKTFIIEKILESLASIDTQKIEL